MPLRTTNASEDERRQIEQEWETGEKLLRLERCPQADVEICPSFSERAYSLANLTVKRRAGLRFIPAVRSDAEWAAYAREALAGQPTPSLTSSATSTKKGDYAAFYRDLARSGSSAPASRSGTPSSSAVLNQPIATSSRITVEELDKRLQGEGTAELPFELDGDDDETELPRSQSTALTAASSSRCIEAPVSHAPSSTTAAVTLPPEDSLTSPTSDNGSLYCLVCQIVVPATDVLTHESTILHNISKNPQYTVAQPLVPPTRYAIRAGNVGYEMMKKLGWAEEQGLGSTETGRKVPLRAVEKFDRKGVGVDASRKRMLEENEGKVSKGSRKAKAVKTAKPLAKNKRELLQAQRSEMQQFKAGLAYLNS